jgi:hypothetical protein
LKNLIRKDNNLKKKIVKRNTRGKRKAKKIKENPEAGIKKTQITLINEFIYI